MKREIGAFAITMSFIAQPSFAQEPALDANCVTDTLRLVYFTAEPNDRSAGIIGNLAEEPDGAAPERPPPPAPTRPTPLPPLGGVPDPCPPIVRPPGDPTAALVCERATVFGAWACVIGEDGSFTIHDMRFPPIGTSTPSQP
jgi:hypothetical protein